MKQRKKVFHEADMKQKAVPEEEAVYTPHTARHCCALDTFPGTTSDVQPSASGLLHPGTPANALERQYVYIRLT